MPQDRRLFIHIGLHKTGSTAIQHALNGSMYHLARAGWHYPSCGRHPQTHIAHDLLRMAYLDLGAGEPFPPAIPIERATIVDALKHEIRIANLANIILSAETLWALDQRAVESLLADFAEFNPFPVIFIRNMADFCDAVIGTILSMDGYHARTVDVADHVRRCETIDFMALGRRWQAASPSGHVMVQDYDSLGGDGSVSAFFNMTGLAKALGWVPREEKANVSESVLVSYLRLHAGDDRFSQYALASLIERLRHVDIAQRFTFVDQETRLRMRKKYIAALRGLRDAEFVQFHGNVPQARRRLQSQAKTYIGSLDDAVAIAERLLADAPDGVART